MWFPLHRNMRPLPARVSREVPRSILKFEMLLGTLDATPKFPNIPVSLDPPREMAGAADHILRTLEAFGFEWDGKVAYQSRRHHLYEAALGRLKNAGLVYPCYCSRKDWQAAAAIGADGFVYNSRCREAANHPDAQGKQPAWRIITPETDIGFSDGIVGTYSQNLRHDIGDFVLLRADGFWAYQLAVVVDDAEQGITHVVRGQDLLVSTPRQIYLQQCLGLPTPHYAHLPLLVNESGQKWSKQTLAPALDSARAETLLRQVMVCLNLPPAPEVDKPQDLLAWAVQHWQPAAIPKQAMFVQI